MAFELKQELRLEMSNRRTRCAVCGGSGLVRTPDNQGSEWEGGCPVCDGTGWVADIELAEAAGWKP
jgi:DnaJ-class molecular chaperone